MPTQPSLFTEFEPHHVALVSEPFFALTNRIYSTIPAGAKREKAIRLVLEARDCALSAATDSPEWVAVNTKQTAPRAQSPRSCPTCAGEMP